MSILNATPDSFSDGGDNSTISTGLATALSHIELGMDIIDIGGMSTRPGASDVEIAEEIARVVPLIEAIREHNSTIPISIDTFRPQVAKAAIEAGATIINDVMGGSTEGMLDLMARLDVPVILMHSRGNLSNMTSMTNYPDGVIVGVRKEMADRVQLAIKNGVKRWNIIVDPGIGFAKTGQDNLVLLRHLPELLIESSCSSLAISSFPSLVGLSRKKFLGTLTGKDNPKDRLMATATGVTSSIAGGADIVRVHDAEEMRDVVRVADGIYRS
jgi:dihydroneopterin aldolase/2-amino-4-hydroxy-6-hydroxymethyldihydropteridine diphosphokinase/dihydropteroate synthase